MKRVTDEFRPDITTSMSWSEFERWYWPVSLLRQFCEELGVPSSGTKKELRMRVAHKLGAPHVHELTEEAPRTISRFNWARERLTADTVITDNVSFGPNVRSYFREAIGKQFVCHSDFMDWVKNNIGATLKDAADAWRVLEARLDDPTFRREIAECNNYLQYLRDLKDANPNLSQAEAKRCWDAKKVRPAHQGRVVYEPDDLHFLD